MKKIFSLCSLLGVILAFFAASSCKPEDTVAPVISLFGANPDTIFLPTVAGGATFSDPGFKATDNKDGDLTNQVKVFGTVNPNLKGEYKLTYSVKDAAGNVVTLNRIVRVVNSAEPLAGLYSNVSDSTVGLTGTQVGTIIIRTDSYVNYMVHFDKFAFKYYDSTVYATATGSTITIPQQTVAFQIVGGPVGYKEKHVYQGTGTDSTNALFAKSIHLTYTDQDSAGNVFQHITVWRP
jgi:hypothetical protein